MQILDIQKLLDNGTRYVCITSDGPVYMDELAYNKYVYAIIEGAIAEPWKISPDVLAAFEIKK